MTQLTKQLTVRQKLVVILALLYFLSPIRLLINALPVIGDVADVFVILCVLATFRDSHLAALQRTKQHPENHFQMD